MLRDMHQPDTDGGHERSTFPDKVQILYSLAQALGNNFRRLQPTILQQDAELVAAQTSEGIAFAQSRLQQRADMPQ